MVRARIMSDLHLNPMCKNGGFDYEYQGEELCILAGDIAEGIRGVEWAFINVPDHVRVLYVPGNHEYYGNNYQELNDRFRDWNLKNNNVRILLNESEDYGGLHFVGSTLWTSFNYFDRPESSAAYWYKGLNDSRWISFGEGRLLHTDVIALHNEALEFLSKEHGILITHYCPHTSVAPQYLYDRLTAGFASKIPDEIWPRFDKHIHGHTHVPFYYKKDGLPEVICNPRGYEFEFVRFNPNLVMNLGGNGFYERN